jgi:hypothetical protein
VAFAGLVLWALRGLFLLAGGALVWLVPVTVYRCEVAGAGTARCWIEATRAGSSPWTPKRSRGSRPPTACPIG